MSFTIDHKNNNTINLLIFLEGRKGIETIATVICVFLIFRMSRWFRYCAILRAQECTSVALAFGCMSKAKQKKRKPASHAYNLISHTNIYLLSSSHLVFSNALARNVVCVLAAAIRSTTIRLALATWTHKNPHTYLLFTTVQLFGCCVITRNDERKCFGYY